MADELERGQVANSAATYYEEQFVPALFGQFAPYVCDAAGLAEGMQVLDVACGTGALTREVAGCIGATGRAVGLDRNAAMLAVARTATPNGEFFEGMAEVLPFEDDSFDAVVSQFGLMFFEDRRNGLAEMGRVARAGSPIAVAVWADLTETPPFYELSKIFDDVVGSNAGDGLRVPYSMGNTDELVALAEEANLSQPNAERVSGRAQFASVAEFVTTEVRGWTLSSSVTDEILSDMIALAETRIAGQGRDQGGFGFTCPAIILNAKA